MGDAHDSGSEGGGFSLCTRETCAIFLERRGLSGERGDGFLGGVGSGLLIFMVVGGGEGYFVETKGACGQVFINEQ